MPNNFHVCVVHSLGFYSYYDVVADNADAAKEQAKRIFISDFCSEKLETKFRGTTTKHTVMADVVYMSHSCYRCGGPCRCSQTPPCCDGCGCDVMAALKKGLQGCPGVEIVNWPWPDDVEIAITKAFAGWCEKCGHVQDDSGPCEKCGHVENPQNDVDKPGG